MKYAFYIMIALVAFAVLYGMSVLAMIDTDPDTKDYRTTADKVTGAIFGWALEQTGLDRYV